MQTVTDVPRLDRRASESHKGTFGHVLTIGGSPGLTGAPQLAALAALRAGAGLSTIGCPRAVQEVVASSASPCIMSLALPDTPAGHLSHTALAPALRFSSRCRAVVLGPGLGRDDDTGDFVASFVTSIEATTVLDADALNLLAGRLEILRDVPGEFVLTPHPGEAARLLERAPGEPAGDPEEDAEAIAGLSGAVVVLKGHRTVVTDGERIYRNDTGNPGMATAGSGDVLAGILGAGLGQGLEPFEAAVWAVHVHGAAGDRAAEALGEVSVIATDLIEHLPAALQG